MNKVFGGIGIAGLAGIVFGLHTAGWLPLTQVQGEELKQMIQSKPASSEVARRDLLFFQSQLRMHKNDFEEARVRLERDFSDKQAREDKINAEMAIEATQEEIRNLYRIWKGTE